MHQFARRVALLLFTAVLLAVSSLPAQTATEIIVGKCVRVFDGDTIEVLVAGRDNIRVRLWGIDCPENAQDFGGRAKDFTADLAGGRFVTVQVRDVDRYGRKVGWVTLPDGRSLNLELVKAGLAWWYRSFAPDAIEIASAEAAARTAGIGLWSGKHPTPPWKWRKARKT